MAAYTDLESCDYLPWDRALPVAVGWLGRESVFETGPVSEDFFCKLRELARHPWQPVISPGIHDCELCQFNPPSFSENLFIPYQDKIFLVPVGILHYISAHWYRPPAIFVDAVLACPPMNSMDYKKALLANGYRRYESESL